MNRLIDGYRRFRATTWKEHRDLYERLAAQGQRPRALVIACSDSRADPALIFGAAPGELFVIRNVANLVPPFAPDEMHHGTSAALEFAVRQLEVKDILVMGHAMCGGIHALLNGPPDPSFDFIGSWIAMARAAVDRVLACTPADRAQTACEHESVRLTLENLMTFPWIRDRVRAGTLALHGAFFDIRSGQLERMGADGGFAAVT
jgi:carbonic anhydrase